MILRCPAPDDSPSCRVCKGEAFFLQEPQAGKSSFEVVTKPKPGADLGDRLLNRQRWTIRPVRHHGFDDVGDGEHARRRQDLLAAKALWVAAAVEALVMLQDDVGDRGSKLDSAPGSRSRCVSVA